MTSAATTAPPPNTTSTNHPPPTSASSTPLTQKSQQTNGNPPLTNPVAKNQPANSRHVNKKKAPEPPDPVTMYESVRSRIAALEEEEEHGEEEDRQNGMNQRVLSLLAS